MSLEMKYLVLKLQKQFDIIELRKKIDNLIDGDDAIGLSMKWLDIADILINVELKEKIKENE